MTEEHERNLRTLLETNMARCPNEQLSIQETDEEEIERLRNQMTKGERGMILNINTIYHEFPETILELTELTELFMSYGHIKSIPDRINSLSLVVLELKEQAFESFPSSVTGISTLEVLDLSDNHISSIPDEISNLKKLKVLNLHKNQLRGELDESVSNLSFLEHLNLSKNFLSRLPECFANLHELNDLKISANSFDRCPNVIESLSKLKTLVLSRNNIKDFNINITLLTRLENLDLESNKLSELNGLVCKLTSLKKLYLGSNKLSLIPDDLKNLMNLQELLLCQNKLTRFPLVVCKLRSLEVLSLSNNNIKSVHSSIAYLRNLKMLALDNCGLEVKMPVAICMLGNLEQLYLGYNNLKKLPPVIRTALPNLKVLDLDGCSKLLAPPMAIIRRGVKAIFNFMDESETNKTIYHKVVLLGNVMAGKSSLAKTLIHGTSHLSGDVDETVVLDKMLWTPEEDLSLQVYDFGGSEWYCVVQHFFLERNPIILLVVDLSTYSDDFYTDCVEQWLKVIQSRAPGATLFLVATHIDKLKPEEVKTKKLRILHVIKEREKRNVENVNHEIARLKREVGDEAESAINGLKICLENRLVLPETIYSVSSKTLENVDKLKKRLLETARETGGFIPTSWLQLYDALHNSKQSTSKQFLPIAEVESLYKDRVERFQAKRCHLRASVRKKPESTMDPSLFCKESDRQSPTSRVPTENDDKSHKGSLQRSETVDDSGSVYKQSPSFHAFSHPKRRLRDVLAFFHSIGDILWYEGNDEIKKFVFHKQSFIIDLMKGIFSHRPESGYRSPQHLTLTQGMSQKCLQMSQEELRSKGILSIILLKGMLEPLNLEDDIIHAIVQLLIHFGLCFAGEVKHGRVTKLHFPWFLAKQPPLEANQMLEKSSLVGCHQFIMEYDFPLGCPKGLFETASIQIHGIVYDTLGIHHWENGVHARLNRTEILLHRYNIAPSETLSFSVRGKDIAELWQILRKLHGMLKALLGNWPGTMVELWLVCPHCTSKGVAKPTLFKGENIETSCPKNEEYVICCSVGKDKVPTSLIYPVMASSNVVTESLISKVAVRISTKWKSLGRSLGLKEYELDKFDDENSQFIEKIHAMMSHWKSSKGDKANVNALKKALLSMIPPQQAIIDNLFNTKDHVKDGIFRPDLLQTDSLHNQTL